MCAGTDTEVHLIIFTCVRYARERIKDREEKRMEITGKNRMESTGEKKMAVRFIIDKRDIQKKARGCPYRENGHPL